ncbi:MAG: hypothetical protein KDC04_04645 [Saprospiraceae bacterium]|nr:hypothetical protein [Saprospiraceae bacterium]
MSLIERSKTAYVPFSFSFSIAISSLVIIVSPAPVQATGFYIHDVTSIKGYIDVTSMSSPISNVSFQTSSEA